MEGNRGVRSFILRGAAADDREPLFRLYRRVMQPFIAEIWGWDAHWQARDFAEHFQTANITVAEADGTLAGYVHAEREPEFVFIRMLLVAPAHRGLGLGTRLLRVVLDTKAPQSAVARLQVFKINHTAKRFYERRGFQVAEETPTSWVMECRR